MRVGQPRLMPRAEKGVIEYFVSAQILQSILHLLHAAGKTDSALNACAVLDSRSEQFYGGVRKHFAHAQTVYIYLLQAWVVYEATGARALRRVRAAK